jgi:hypothetical protein
VKEIELYNGVQATNSQQVEKWIRMIPDPNKKRRNKRNEKLCF